MTRSIGRGRPQDFRVGPGRRRRMAFMRTRPLLGLVLSFGLGSAVLFGGRGAHSQPSAPDASASAPSGRAPELEAAVRSLVHDRALKDALVGVVIMDCESG